MPIPPKPRSILITGASSGIGAALARHYAGSGVTLVIMGRNSERLEGVARSCRESGAEVRAVCADVGNTQELARLIAEADADCPIDLVVANAGMEASVGAGGEPESLDRSLQQITTNLAGAIATVQPLIAPMQARRRGQIVLIASLAALMPLPDQPAYSASKAGLLAWGQALMPLLAQFGVQVTVVCPGFVATGMKDNFGGWRPLEWSAARAARVIARSVARGRPFLAFPWPLVLLVRLGLVVPRNLRSVVLQRFFRVDIRS